MIGPDMTLTIDFDLQKEAAAQLAGRRGAVVVINLRPASCSPWRALPVLIPMTSTTMCGGVRSRAM